MTEHAHTHTHTHVISGQNIRYSCFNFHFLSDVEYFFMFGFIISMLFCLSSDIPIFQVGFLKSFFIYLCGLFDVLLSRFGTSVCSRSSSNCCFLTCVQISQEAGQVVWYSISFRIFQFVLIHTVKSFGIVNNTKVDVFLALSCSLMIQRILDVGNLISDSSPFSKTSLNIWKFTVHILLKPGLRTLSMSLLVCEMSAVVW